MSEQLNVCIEKLESAKLCIGMLHCELQLHMHNGGVDDTLRASMNMYKEIEQTLSTLKQPEETVDNG